MVSCLNAECKNGKVPGVIASGRGSAKVPLVGAVMRWGWTNCRSCSPKDKDPAYVAVKRTKEEIDERWRLAEARAEYKPVQPATQLQRIRLATKDPPPIATSPPPDNGRLDKLLDQVTKLSEQVSQLLEENRQLRSEIAGASPPKSRVKKSVAAKARPS